MVEDVKDRFYEDLISLVSNVRENELLMLVGDLNRHFRKDVNSYMEFMEVLGNLEI